VELSVIRKCGESDRCGGIAACGALTSGSANANGYKLDAQAATVLTVPGTPMQRQVTKRPSWLFERGTASPAEGQVSLVVTKPPVCVAGATQPCTSAPNSCGETAIGNETCQGNGTWPSSCPVPPPSNSDCTSSFSVSLSASPASGPTPLTTILTSKASTTDVTDTLNYSIFFDCSYAGTDLSIAEATCGSLPAPNPGSCTVNSIGEKCDATTTLSLPISATYSAVNTYNPKVIVEQGSNSPVTATTPVVAKAGSGTHLTCVSGTCSVVVGSGTDDCSACPIVGQTHLGCVTGTCSIISGSGADDCTACSNGGTHLACIASSACGVVSGSGQDDCSTCDLGPTHLACSSGTCAFVPGSGTDDCSACTPSASFSVSLSASPASGPTPLTTTLTSNVTTTDVTDT